VAVLIVDGVVDMHAVDDIHVHIEDIHDDVIDVGALIMLVLDMI
jgi:hypothetical protein